MPVRLVRAAVAALAVALPIAGLADVTPSQPAALTVSEDVTNEASTGDGGNAWGGHQSRMVRTAAGLFTAYTTPGRDPFHRTWNLAWRRDGAWKVVATGPSGRDPPSLLANARGELFIVAWAPPYTAPTLWSGTPDPRSGTISAARAGVVPGNWLYAVYAAYVGAAIGPDGAIYIEVGYGADGTTEAFVFSRRDPTTSAWTTNTVNTLALTGLHGRYNYAYILPESNRRGVWVIATRNDNWATLGYARPPGAFGYVYDRVVAFHTSDAAVVHPTWTATLVRAERQASPETEPYCSATSTGGLLDAAGRLHVLYGLTPDLKTLAPTMRHAVISPGGKVLDDQAIPGHADRYVRAVANRDGKLFIVGAAGGSRLDVYPVPDPSRAAVGGRTALRAGANVLYAGLMGADPRGGTPSSDTWDFGFPSGSAGETWRRGQIRLPAS